MLYNIGDEMKTITREKLYRLSFINSKHLPRKVNDNGVLKEWVGIGWIELDQKPTKRHVRLID